MKPPFTWLAVLCLTAGPLAAGGSKSKRNQVPMPKTPSLKQPLRTTPSTALGAGSLNDLMSLLGGAGGAGNMGGMDVSALLGLLGNVSQMYQGALGGGAGGGNLDINSLFGALGGAGGANNAQLGNLLGMLGGAQGQQGLQGLQGLDLNALLGALGGVTGQAARRPATRTATPTRLCAKCRRPMQANWKFCPYDGSKRFLVVKHKPSKRARSAANSVPMPATPPSAH